MIVKKNIEAKFRRSRIEPKKTYLWSEMPEGLKFTVECKIQLQENEFCIICFYQSEYVLLITTSRIIVIDGKESNSYFYTLIKDVRLNEIFNERQTKEYNETVNLILKSGEQIDIIVEKGTWHVLYSIIKLITSQANTSE